MRCLTTSGHCWMRTTRRKFLSFTTVGIASVGLLGASAAISPSRWATKLSPDDALARLKAGNEKFLSAPQLCEMNLAAIRTEVAKGQSPWATILTCADSRVPPELVFGGVVLGELFVARNAGNTATPTPWARSNMAPSISVRH